MLTFTNSEERQSQCFHLLGTAKTTKSSTHLISDNTNLISNVPSLLAGGGEDTCSFYSGPSDATIMAFGEQSESCGSIAYSGESESCGSIAYSGGASAGVSVSTSSAGGCSSSGGGCSYSC